MSDPQAPSARPATREFHAYPWWSPRFWHGMPAGIWFTLVREHGGRIGLTKLGLATTVSLMSGLNSMLGPLSDARYRRQLRRPPETPPPLFIVGHWRSGTTLLHELAMLDDRFCCPNTYECFAPGHFLLTEDVLTRALSWMIPAKRPMDDVAAGWDRPQEDEFALMNLGAPSCYRRIAFPFSSPDHPEALDLTTLPAAEVERWKRSLRRFLQMLAVRDPRRPVLKSPPHTARLGVLAEMFPESRFLHVVRDPFVVIPSTLRLWRSLHDVQSLQVDRGESLERYVFAAFAEMHAAFERDRAMLAPGRLFEVRYEQLVADPVATLAEAYERLGLGEFDRLRPALERQAAAMRKYRTNSYRHDPRLVAEIATRCRGFLDRYGYAAPAVG
ncbi:MAG: sulfotransferase [Planctomycetes bacterium]|nr:sulfotransferase [Planctomycetota bacterium]